MDNKTRIYVIQNEHGQVTNVLSDIGGVEIAIITTSNEREDGAVDASLQHVFVEEAAPKEEVDDIESFIASAPALTQEPVTQDEA